MLTAHNMHNSIHNNYRSLGLDLGVIAQTKLAVMRLIKAAISMRTATRKLKERGLLN